MGVSTQSTWEELIIGLNIEKLKIWCKILNKKL